MSQLIHTSMLIRFLNLNFFPFYIALLDLQYNDIILRILIVDLDIHHGQGTQQIFYEDKRFALDISRFFQEHGLYVFRVMVFSIHRYEDGKFWPHLRESNFDHIGDAEGAGYNINVTLNEVTFIN